ncbi:hypothetical protein BH09MYX1_BH09MYX1_15980 [soil metagenome]
MRHDDWNLVHDLMVATMVELWGELDVPVTFTGSLSQRDAQWSGTLAVIGFGGAKMRGTLVLGAPDELLARTHPVQSKDPLDLVDWLAELSNQTLGRMKARLLAHDLVIETATPLTISAAALRLRSFQGPPLLMLFSSPEGPIQIAFEATGEHHVELAPKQTTAVTAPAGELILF